MENTNKKLFGLVYLRKDPLLDSLLLQHRNILEHHSDNFVDLIEALLCQLNGDLEKAKVGSRKEHPSAQCGPKAQSLELRQHAAWSFMAEQVGEKSFGLIIIIIIKKKLF